MVSYGFPMVFLWFSYGKPHLFQENVTFPDFDLDATDLAGSLTWEDAMISDFRAWISESIYFFPQENIGKMRDILWTYYGNIWIIYSSFNGNIWWYLQILDIFHLSLSGHIIGGDASVTSHHGFVAVKSLCAARSHQMLRLWPTMRRAIGFWRWMDKPYVFKHNLECFHSHSGDINQVTRYSPDMTFFTGSTRCSEYVFIGWSPWVCPEKRGSYSPPKKLFVVRCFPTTFSCQNIILLEQNILIRFGKCYLTVEHSLSGGFLPNINWLTETYLPKRASQSVNILAISLRAE